MRLGWLSVVSRVLISADRAAGFFYFVSNCLQREPSTGQFSDTTPIFLLTDCLHSQTGFFRTVLPGYLLAPRLSSELHGEARRLASSTGSAVRRADVCFSAELPKSTVLPISMQGVFIGPLTSTHRRGTHRDEHARLFSGRVVRGWHPGRQEGVHSVVSWQKSDRRPGSAQMPGSGTDDAAQEWRGQKGHILFCGI